MSIATVAREVRRHPVRALAISAGAGALLGAALGALANRIVRAATACSD